MRIALLTVAVAAALLVVGCGSTGLSPRETGSAHISSYTFRLHAAAVDAPPAGPVVLPVRLAVAQVGEVAPPESFMQTLRDSGLYASVQAIPAAMPVPPAHVQHGGRLHSNDWATDKELDEQLLQMRQMASSMGADYLLLLGGTIDTTERATGLSLLDLTIVGAFLVPSRKLEGEARATAVMVESDSGRPVLTANASADAGRWAASAGADGDRIVLLKRLRDDVLADLATNLNQQLSTRSGAVTTAR